ncbi:MAG: shikimate dehydrogenase [Oceanospirillaceae bacterium]|nr:shikimate dehydrogenase [Oceanospirillaceae bacterium]
MNLGLIGLSIKKSSSPQMHHLLGELNKLSLIYRLHEPKENSNAAFSTTLKALRERNYQGVNITYPFKQIALEYCDCVDEAVHLVGATNTLKISEQSIQGFNTDYSGFIRAYQHRLGSLAAGKVLLIGAGGVGRAIAFALFKLGATQVVIYDLNQQAADSLALALNEAGFVANTLDAASLTKEAQGCNGLINCTPVGHYTMLGLPIEVAAIGNQQWAFDAVYTPLDTQFLQECAQEGLRIVTGFDLFYYQALNAFEIFTGIEVDAVEVMEEYSRRFLINSQLV